MRGSIRVFKIFGIGINIHITFLLLPLLFSVFYGARGVTLILLVFCFVTMHELCHSIVATKFGIKVDSITLLPIGGLAAMRGIPEKPSQELAISLAGPLFNLVAALVLFFPLYLMLGPQNLSWPPEIESWGKVFAYAFWINPVLAMFNLLPAFPMDGGRIVRSYLAGKMDYRRATEVAVGIGHLFAILFAITGILSRPVNIILIAIAIFIYMAASQEELQVNVRTALRRFYVEDVLLEDFFTVAADARLKEVMDLMMHSRQEDFPVVKGGKLVGLLLRDDIMRMAEQGGKDNFAEAAMLRHFPTLKPRQRLDIAHKKFEEWGIKALPVIKKDRLAGILTIEDIKRVYSMMGPKKKHC